MAVTPVPQFTMNNITQKNADDFLLALQAMCGMSGVPSPASLPANQTNLNVSIAGYGLTANVNYNSVTQTMVIDTFTFPIYLTGAGMASINQGYEDIMSEVQS